MFNREICLDRRRWKTSNATGQRGRTRRVVARLHPAMGTPEVIREARSARGPRSCAIGEGAADGRVACEGECVASFRASVERRRVRPALFAPDNRPEPRTVQHDSCQLATGVMARRSTHLHHVGEKSRRSMIRGSLSEVRSNPRCSSFRGGPVISFLNECASSVCDAWLLPFASARSRTERSPLMRTPEETILAVARNLATNAEAG